MGAMNDIREAWIGRYDDVSDTIETILEMGIALPTQEAWNSMDKDERKNYIHALATKITHFEIERSSQ
mgnify:CR=1 FL=1